MWQRDRGAGKVGEGHGGGARKRWASRRQFEQNPQGYETVRRDGSTR